MSPPKTPFIYDQSRIALQARQNVVFSSDTEASITTMGGAIMPTPDVLDWDAIISDPRFQNSRRLESRSLWRLMAFALWPGAL
jgi:hypothetical protein